LDLIFGEFKEHANVPNFPAHILAINAREKVYRVDGKTHPYITLTMRVSAAAEYHPAP